MKLLTHFGVYLRMKNPISQKNIFKFLIFLLVIFIYQNSYVFGQIGPGVGADTIDAKKVISEAVEAIKKISNVSYKAAYNGTGAFATHTQNVEGNVTIGKLEPDNPLKIKFAANGIYFQTGTDEAQKFHTVFDGTAVYKLRPKENAVLKKIIELNNPTERKLGFVTSFFGGGAYQLTMFQFFEDEPLAFQLKADVADYEGRTVINGIACHVIYVEYLRNEKKTRERWYFGIKDSLARRLEILATDDKGRHGSYDLTLSDLRVNQKLSETNFRINVPKDFVVKDYESPNRSTSLPVDSVAPNWTLLDANNKAHSLEDYRGKIVVLDFWATWCGPCVKAMSELQKLHEKFKAQGVEIIGINVWEESNAVVYMRQRGFDYTLLLNGEKVANSYGVSTLPAFYLIGADGKIIYEAAGLPKDIEIQIEEYLKKIKSAQTFK